MKHFIWILFLMLTFSGCSTINKPAATTPSSTPKVTWASREAALSQLTRWHLNGKIAVQSSHDSGSASVDWLQNQQRYTISLQGPLGAGAMKLSGQPGEVMLQASDGKSYHANSAEQLLAKQWGFHLPVSSLNYWVRGLPVPGLAANTRFDNSGRLETVIQQGYRVDFLSYSSTGRMELPEKISITSPSLRVKLVIYQWNVV